MLIHFSLLLMFSGAQGFISQKKKSPTLYFAEQKINGFASLEGKKVLVLGLSFLIWGPTSPVPFTTHSTPSIPEKENLGPLTSTQQHVLDCLTFSSPGSCLTPNFSGLSSVSYPFLDLDSWLLICLLFLLATNTG